MKAGWNEVALGDVASINQRPINLPPDDESVSFVPMADLIASEARTTAGERRRFCEVSKGYTHFQRDDILLAKITPCFENGKIGRATIETALGAGSTEFHVIRPDPKRLDTGYALHFLRQSKIRQQGILRMTGSAGQRRVPEAFLQALGVPLPPLAEQRRIAQILDKAHTMIRARSDLLEKLRELKESLLADVISGSPAQDSRLGELAHVQGGLQVTKARDRHAQKVPYLRVANALRGRFDLSEIKMLGVTPAELKRCALRSEDLVIVEGHGNLTEVGRAARWRGSISLCVHQNHLIRVRCHPELVPSFAEAYINSSGGRAQFRRASKTTSGLNTISVNDVRRISVPVPDMARQRAFDTVIVSIEDQEDAAQRHLRCLEALFASLQCRAFNGEL